MADSQGSVERPVRNVADVEFFFVAGMAAGGTRPTVARREFRDWLAERDRKAAVERDALRAEVERARCSECGPGYRVGDEGCRHRPAPVVPDSADVREVRTADGRVLTPAQVAALDGLTERLSWPSLHWGVESVSPEAWPHLAIAAADAVLAVMGQDVTVDDVPEQIARYVEATATDLSPSGYRAGIATAVRLIRRWRPEYAAVRPSGQEADRDR